MAEAYPLEWPSGKPRTLYPEWSRFRVSQGKAQRELMREIELLGGRLPVLSTDVELRLDGQPYASRRPPADQGVAVYFEYDGASVCMACDRWLSLGDNIWAIAKSINALRGIERWGAKDMVRSAFQGFKQLPQPPQWWDVLGLAPEASSEEILSARLSLTRLYHPDYGTEKDAARMGSINGAVEIGLSYSRASLAVREA